ncbi:peptide/nickel transport system substrate-binding protein [Arthrobacter sp. SLBN-100]|nr:peptide/nickel transport system substrate-binding protein [Arthrobacter sp. SLBN-100]
MRSKLSKTLATRIRVGALAALTVFALSACSGPSAGSPEPGSPSVKNFSLAIQTPISSMEPANLNDGQAAYVWSAIYDTLLFVDHNGEVQPNGAKKWEYDPDKTRLTLVIRDDMKFSDGQPVTVADVVATLERSRTAKGLQAPALSAVASVTATDDKTVVLQLSRPDPVLLIALSQGAGAIAPAKALDNKDIVANPIGSGPYVLDKATVPGSSYVLTRRDDYWNLGAFPFPKLTFRVIADPTAQFNALQAGELTAGQLQPQQVAPMEAKGLKVTRLAGQAHLTMLLLDKKGELVPALADERVRKAINMAFDREGIVKAILQGAGKPTVQIFNPDSKEYNEKLEGYYKYDVQGAKNLLAEAGYKDGFSVTMPSTPYSTTFEPTVTQALGDIGIKVSWEPVPPQNTGAAIAGKKFPMVLYIDALPAAQKMIGTYYGPNAYTNPFRYTDPELEKLVAATATADEAERVELSKKIAAFATEHALNAPIAYMGGTIATDPGVEFVDPKSAMGSNVRQYEQAK